MLRLLTRGIAAAALLLPSSLSAQDSAGLKMPQITHVDPGIGRQIIAIRDTAWRAYFANDQATMGRLFPDNFISIGWSGGPWLDRQGTMADAAQFASKGGKLVALDFPHTEIQLFGDVAVVYSLYVVEFQFEGITSRQSGRATEVFQRKDGHWIHPSWHLDSGR
jgi:hypothetical protein